MAVILALGVQHIELLDLVSVGDKPKLLEVVKILSLMVL